MVVMISELIPGQLHDGRLWTLWCWTRGSFKIATNELLIYIYHNAYVVVVMRIAHWIKV